MSRTIKKIGIIGHFGFGKELSNGQTVKTKVVSDALEKRFSSDEIVKEDTHGGIKALFSLPFLLFRLLRRCENIIILPAQRGLKIMVPLLSFFNRFFHRRLHYCVIGGWMPSLIKDKKILIYMLKQFDGIYVETTVMRTALESMGFSNITIVPNCKPLKPSVKRRSETVYAEPYHLCTFSRVMKEKGIEDAVSAVCSVNKAIGKTAFTLDIFGGVDPSQTEWFKHLKASFPEYIRYRGVVPYDLSAETIDPFFALLFPTRFYTEGIPGTIIDAYAAGVPVVAAKWESFSDIIDEGKTGIGYGFDDRDGLYRSLEMIYENPTCLIEMKKHCADRMADYIPENALLPLFERIGA